MYMAHAQSSITAVPARQGSGSAAMGVSALFSLSLAILLLGCLHQAA